MDYAYFGNESPNIGFPLLDFCSVALVLNDVPVFDENPILQANHVRRDPVHRQSDVGESAMNDNVLTLCKNHSGLIPERRRRGLDEVEEPLSTRLDVGAMLNVVGRPEPLRRLVVALIKQGIECFQDDRLFFSASLKSLMVLPLLKWTLDFFAVSSLK